jgi:hypothetical protein
LNDLDTYKNITTFNEYKSTTNYDTSRYDYGLKNTSATTNAYDAYNSSSLVTNSYNYNTTYSKIDKYESNYLSDYNLGNIASVYVPIEGYKVSIDN